MDSLRLRRIINNLDGGSIRPTLRREMNCRMVPGMLSVVRVSVRAVAKDRRARGRATNDLIRLLRPVVTLERRRKRESSVGLARSDLGHHQSNNASTRIIAMEQSIYPNHPTLFRLSISAPLSELCPIHSSRCATRTLPHTPFDVFFLLIVMQGSCAMRNQVLSNRGSSS